MIIQIQEIVKISKWEDKNWEMNDREVRIMDKWGLTKEDQGWEIGKLRMHP